MILPIVAYGHPVLRKVAHDIDKDHPGLPKLIEDMWETLYASCWRWFGGSPGKQGYPAFRGRF